MKKYKLSIHTVFISRENIFFIKEWLLHHNHIGVEHFYLYDNTGSIGRRGSTKSVNKYGIDFEALTNHLTNEDVQRTITSIVNDDNLAGKCHLIPWQPRDIDNNIVYGYNESVIHCIQNYGEHNEWMCFIDMDEFLFSPNNKHLHKILDNLKRNRVSRAIILQKKFADRFLNLDKYVTDIYECIEGKDTRLWAPKNIMVPEQVDLDNINNMHDMAVKEGKTKVMKTNLLRFNHYNINPQTILWMQRFYQKKDYRVSTDEGMKKYQQYIHSHNAINDSLRVNKMV